MTEDVIGWYVVAMVFVALIAASACFVEITHKDKRRDDD